MPFDEDTDHIHPGLPPPNCTHRDRRPTPRARADCWAPDYCNPEQFRYQLCKLRVRTRPGKGKSEHVCPEGQFCEEIDCAHKCFLPPSCRCETEAGPFQNRMLCEEGACFSHPTTQWGLCAPMPEGWAGDEDEPLPLDFHFYTEDELCAPPTPRPRGRRAHARRIVRSAQALQRAPAHQRGLADEGRAPRRERRALTRATPAGVAVCCTYRLVRGHILFISW